MQLFLLNQQFGSVSNFSDVYWDLQTSHEYRDCFNDIWLVRLAKTEFPVGCKKRNIDFSID